MTEFIKFRFKELFESPLRNGLTKPSRVRGSGFRMVNMKEIFGYNFITDETPMELVPLTDKEKERAFLKHGDLLFARQSLVASGAGKISIFLGFEPTVFESHLIRCRIDKNKAIPKLIYYYFSSTLGKNLMSTIVEQTAAAGIRSSDLKNLKINLPDLQTQKAIAEILSSLDDKIELNNKINENLEELAQTIFNNLIASNTSPETVTVEHYVLFNPRMSIKKGTMTKFVEMKFLPTNGMNVSKVSAKPFTAGSKFVANDTLLARITPCLENGKTAFVNFLKEGEKGFGSTEFITMRANENSCPEFVYCLSRNPAFRNHAIGSMVGSSGRQRIQLDMLKDFEIPKLSKEQICKFKNFSEPVFKQISHNRKENTNLIQLRDTLLPELITGKLEVSEQE